MSPTPAPIPLASRLAKLPPYLFAEIDKNKREARARGVDLIDMGIGDPDLPTPPHIIEAIKRSAETPANHRYPDYEGLLTFRTAVANWYRGRFGVTLDPQSEVLTLIGSKEGTAHMPLAFVNPGDVVLVPDPGYPVYAAGTWFADGEVHFMPLRRANGFLPDLDAIPADVAKRAKLMYLNYPEQPHRGGGDARVLRAGRRLRAAAPDHRLPRRDVLGAALRRLPPALLPRDARARWTSASSSTRCPRPIR